MQKLYFNLIVLILLLIIFYIHRNNINKRIKTRERKYYIWTYFIHICIIIHENFFRHLLIIYLVGICVSQLSVLNVSNKQKLHVSMETYISFLEVMRIIIH